ncbi:MAG: tRNA (adenosine(37)-N6)-threonylcarbamoyltransferase complex transferase subunit TsaD [Flavobacteriales bacterium]|nr:tRNA (adenosine(37)-N6)-threonylcarbamoyltransferase complex transferase subunit TsaD [Flavobacteriales bacterium]
MRPRLILGIESSCDDTAAAVLEDGRLKSNVVAGQSVHRAWGGVVPELASRAHQENIVPVVHAALEQAGIRPRDLSAIAFTQGPGLIGALLVGGSFARSMAQALGIPLLAVHHMEAHVLAHFIRDEIDRPAPSFPFLNLTVSGGHTLLVLVHGPLDMEVIGTTLDDAAGEAFDKGAKVMGLPYPGGPEVDRLARTGDAAKYPLPFPEVQGLNMSFSGIKVAFQRVVRNVSTDQLPTELPHLCASLQEGILRVLLTRVRQAMRQHDLREVGCSGGVSANSALRARLLALGEREGWVVHIPPPAYCTDNAAMIAMAGHFLLEAGRLATPADLPRARL